MRTSTMLKVPAGLIAAVLAVTSLAPVAQARVSGFVVKMKVPFAFETSSGQHFGPGVYTVRMSGQQTMLIQGTETSGMALTQLADDGFPATEGKAEFTRYGNRYFLRAVWVAGNTSHLLCNISKAERQSQIAAVKTPSTIDVSVLQEER